MKEIIITKDTTLGQEEILNARIVIMASNITIDGGGATLVGPAKVGDRASFESAGAGITAKGMTNVILKNITVKGFASGLVLTDCRGLVIEGCDFSDNYHNPEHGWGELPARGGIILIGVHDSLFRKNKANNVWDALNMTDCCDNDFVDNDFSHCSNVCAKLWTSSRNRFVRNNLSYGLRIDRSIGEVHARDSTGVLIESGSDDNYWYRNDITYGGDGVFIRVLNGWISVGNVFVENDTSYANNNCVESWSPRNVFIRNKANCGSYGFWMGGSDASVLIGNECAHNGYYQNAPMSEFMGFAGIIFAGGPGSHTICEGNYCHHNGSGIVIQGHIKSEGKDWNIHHWIIQNNRLENNRRALYMETADWIFIGPNEVSDNAEEDFVKDVTRIKKGVPSDGVTTSPVAKAEGPELVRVGDPVTFDASASYDPQGAPLSFEWQLGKTASKKAVITHTFTEPGFHRVGLLVDNGTFAALDYRNVIAVDDSAADIGTEFEADKWMCDTPGVKLDNDTDALVGKYSLLIEPESYSRETLTVTYPRAKDAGWDLSGKSKITFWLKMINPNIPVEEGDNGRVSVSLHGESGEVRFTAKNYRMISDGAYSEARTGWHRMEIPLSGEGTEWVKEGDATLEAVNAISLSLWYAAEMPFKVWIDGLAFE